MPHSSCRLAIFTLALCPLVLPGEVRAFADSILVFNEVHYNPADDVADTEWIEFHNLNGVNVDISGWRLRGGVDFDFPNGTVVEGHGFLLVAADPGNAKLAGRGALGPFIGALNNGGEVVRIENRDQRTMDSLSYSDSGDWPIGPDGSGATLSKRDQGSADNRPANWIASREIGGTPGLPNTPLADVPPVVVDTLVFNEFTAHDAGGGFRLELANLSEAPVILNGYQIGFSEGGTMTFTGGMIESGEFAVIDQAMLGFAPGNDDRLFLYNPAGDLVDARRVTGRLRGRSAEFGGRWLYPTGETFAAANTFSFENDIVINEIMYHPRPQPSSPATAAVFETWIELHNRSPDRTIDLAGWRFSDGVTFEFPPGAMLAPGGFLVVARDAAALSAKHPGVNVIGEFSGRLSRAGERLRLVDAMGNPADEVRYADGGRWPGKADGGGSSLELRDPDADNNLGGAWSASEESHRGSWTTYTRAARATSGSNDPTGYHEFIFGLLDEGEVLIDDISVIENPGSGSARELIQNGDFRSRDARYWRMRGTHRHFEVIDDPDAPGNKVLHVSASGPTEHMHNCAETTLKVRASYVSINSSRSYQITFRARWVSGSNQLNSRLYFNRIPRTDLLAIDDPYGGGTPGRANSTAEANAGPTFASAIHAPAVPAANQAAEINAHIWDPDGVASATVHYSVNSGSFRQVAMSGAAGGRFLATIPPQAVNTRVQFYIEAVDTLGARSFFPRAGAESRAMIPWQDNRARLQRGSVFPTNLRIVMPIVDATFMHTVTEVMSNDRLPCTIIHNEKNIYYGCTVRLKSSERGRANDGRVGFNIKFPSDNRFLGAHASISCDRSGQQEIMVKHMAAHVGDVPAMFDDIAWVIQPRANRATSAILMKSRFDNEWLENQFPGGGDGSMFEFELIYHPTTTTGGVEGLKRPQPDGVRGVPMRNQGGQDKELYRWHWLLKNNRDVDDYSGMINLLNTMGMSTAAYNRVVEEVIDVDQFLRTFAFLNLMGIGDNYGTHGSGAWHNAIFYIRPTDGKAMFFPWDMDFTFTNSATSGVTPSSDLNKMIAASPGNKRAYYGHLLDMILTTFNTRYMTEWLRHYSQFLDSSLIGHSNYINTRFRHIRLLINGAVANVAFGVSTSSGGSTPGSTTTVRGDGWINVRELRLAGTLAPLAVRWTDDNSWEVTLPVAPGVNNFTIEALGFDGRLIGSDTFSITGTGAVIPADASNLAISEIHYHPIAPDAIEIAAGFTDPSMFEWIELLNLSETSTLDLANLAFDDGIELVIPAGTALAPGERLVVPANASAFTQRYGALVEGRLLSRSYLNPNGSNSFSNGGEHVLLLSAAAQPIAEFTYNDNRPWPLSADGAGYSLTLMCPNRNDPMLPQSWRSSAALGGSPGGDDVIPLASWQSDHGVVDLLGDTDGDGIPALIEYLSGTDPALPDGSPVTVVVAGADLRLEVRQRIGADEVDLGAERAEDLMTWSSAEVEYWGRENNGDGTATLRFRTPSAGFLSGEGFLRLSVSEKD
ncbi:MAG: lamin tail domain-containing protein [Roseibacillus sp.]